MPNLEWKFHEYVLCYAEARDPILGLHDQIYVLKKRPEVQAGRINLPGGKVEGTDKDPIAAACRELYEETGLPWNDVQYSGLIYGDHEKWSYGVHVVRFSVPRASIKPRQGEDEDFFWSSWSTIKNDKLLLPNLRIIVPLLQSGVNGWEIQDLNLSPDVKPYKINFSFIHQEEKE